jgi:hypothetical protein
MFQLLLVFVLIAIVAGGNSNVVKSSDKGIKLYYCIQLINILICY